MTKTGDRDYTTYLAMTGATPEKGVHHPPCGGYPATHLRIDVGHWDTKKALILVIQGVERKANGIESCLLLGDDSRRARINLEPMPRFNRKKLVDWATRVQERITQEYGVVWEVIEGVRMAHGASLAK